MKKYAIIVAGGSGLRMQSDIPKQFLLLNNKPVLWYTINAFVKAYDDIGIILVLPGEYLKEGMGFKTQFPSHTITVTAGGNTRFHSVKNGLQLVTEKSVVLVHDGVRCLVSKELIHRCYETALKKGNAVAAVKATDSIRIETQGVNKQVDRNSVYIIQTPQAFRSEVLLPAFEKEYDPAFTDEASVVESSSMHAIYLVEGEAANIKITRSVDLLVAEKILQEREAGKER